MNKVVIDFDKKSVAGKATFEGKKLESLNFGNSQRLRQDLTYVIPAQYVHAEKMQINGVNRVAPKVFAVGYDDKGEAQVITTLSINTLRARHLGKVIDGAPSIKLVRKDGLYRAETAPKQTSVFISGSLPIQTEGNEAKVPRNFGFKVNDRYQVYNFKFAETSTGSGKWNIVAKEGTDIADLDPQTVNEYVETGVVSADTAMIPDFDAYACN